MATPSIPQPRSHRKAYGSHRPMTPAIKARNIAQSIALRIDEHREWSWQQYGLDDKPEMIALVEAALHALSN